MSEPKRKKRLTERKPDNQARWAKTTWLSVLAVVIAIAGQLEAVEGFLTTMGAPADVVGIVLGALGLAGLIGMAITKELED